MIEIRHLTKRFGAVLALDHVSLDIESGTVFGLIGPNGAGKTTCFNILATLTKPDGGTVRIDGLSIREDVREIRKRLGFMPDFFGTYPSLTTHQYLDFFGGCCGMPFARRMRRIDEVLELTHLEDKRDEMVDNLSRGMKQRLCLAKTLIHEPPLLVLDEPASGLDPRARREIREILRDVAACNRTVLISSHILSELEPLCSHIGILEQGRLVHAGLIADALKTAHPAPVWALEVGAEPDRAAALLMTLETVRLATVVGRSVMVTLMEERPDGVPLDVVQALQQAGIAVVACTRARAGLEDAFMSLTQGLLA